MPSQTSLENLRPAWEPGYAPNARANNSRHKRVLKASREASPRAIQRAIECMDCPDAPWPARLRAVEIILDRAWGAPDQRLEVDANGIALLRVEFVDNRDAQHKPNGQIVDVPFDAPTEAP